MNPLVTITGGYNTHKIQRNIRNNIHFEMKEVIVMKKVSEIVDKILEMVG